MGGAMSSGLVPVSSYNIAIPEFLNFEQGYLTKNYIEIAHSIIELSENFSVFSKKVLIHQFL